MRESSQQEFDQQVRGKPFDRYITTWHVTVSEDEARRLCVQDRCRWEEVAITRGLKIVQNDTEFTLWSDDRVTRPLFGLPYGGSLSQDALRLLRLLCAADWGMVEGGEATLARVARVVQEQEIDPGVPRDGRYRERFTQMDVLWADGSAGVLYAHFMAQFEGYIYTVYQSLPALQRAISKGP